LAAGSDNLAAQVMGSRSRWLPAAVPHTLATIVSFDRANDRVHFVGDVFAGAAVGVSVGRFVVGRHEPEEAAKAALHVEILPIRDGIGARLAF
jgi:membrane-associated phospholipid phosphatase